ncbi:MAG: 50S ribosomal protein L23 [Candidatus Thermoplasmatota archaeon]|jgi:large subunit ribosomal protein L23|nr:50S ribosomal protein L23 [Candidatus Thermoplasmatota archaeon]MCL5790244.1 50S ribosomal protein L23 [Candidatus Thermoplasmatota archaeon]
MKSPYDILLKPFVTEKSMLQIERDNKIWFIVNERATRDQVKRAVEEISEMKVSNVNILRDKEGKKAIVKISKDFSAEELATKLGIF